MTIDELITRSVVEVIRKDDLIKKLKSGRKLNIKLGADPTKPDLHLGHVVVLRKLREFQEQGHRIIFVIGDYTTRIGDPSERNATRPILSEKEIEANAETYAKQVSKILDLTKIQIRRNSEWLSKLSLAEFLSIASKLTAASILERDDFQNRLKKGIDVGLHELFYPVMQAYDSVVLKADVELGGTDQKFNLLAGRELMKKMGMEPQSIITLPLLVGTDGRQKMSKSLGNYIALNDLPKDIFGKVMSIPDELIIPYYQSATDITQGGLVVIEKELKEGKNPRDLKLKLAYLVTEEIYTSREAEDAQAEFERVFSKKELPSKMPTKKLPEVQYRADELLFKAGLATSRSEAKRLLEQGGVEINGLRIIDPYSKIKIKKGDIIQVGKRRFIKVQAK